MPNEEKEAKNVNQSVPSNVTPITFVDANTDRQMYDSTMRIINQGLIPDLYIYNQELTRVEVHEDRFGRYVKAEQVNKHMLCTMLVNSVPVVRNKGGNMTDELPKASVMESILNNSLDRFPGVRRIDHITNVPTLLPNKKFLTEPGYDEETRTFYEPLNLNYAADTKPTKTKINKARAFLLNQVLGDFPWVSESDKTNAFSYLVTQVIKTAYQHLIPLAFITSPQAGSGKTLIADLNLEIFGGSRKSFPSQEEELRKTIFSALRGTQPTIVFDNVDTGSTLNSPYLAEILTSYRHTDRILGQSREQEVVNGRIWMATGNNLNIGGDLATRIVPIRINPNMPNPEKREGFKLNLSKLSNETKLEIFQSLTILIQDWLNAGAPERNFTMRTFTAWASTLAGFMDHHRVPGFLENINEVILEQDEEKSHNEAFLHLVHEHFKDEWFSTVELRKKAVGELQQTQDYKTRIINPNNELAHYLPQSADGTVNNIQSIGKFLGKIKETHFGPYQLVSQKNRKTKQNTYRVIKDEARAE